MIASGYAWPIVEAHVKYVQPARFNDRLVERQRQGRGGARARPHRRLIAALLPLLCLGLAELSHAAPDVTPAPAGVEPYPR